ncbi:hypothetical protein UFOVP346_51 [uncultured Caudovirales phage]|uniref:Uncharacterized protein n=1 Tax=uncultured Caudovirales phage TaxID=2100421 RepID=A0A6J5M6L9_9CAUD|nr:hypothetical protein UFOVP346_51 [uncultured Caudovirales phage]
MAFDFATIRPLLREHGVTVTLRKRVTGAYSVSTGTVTATNTDYSVLGYSYKLTSDSVDENLVSGGNRRLVIDNLQTNGTALPAPDTSDQVIVNGSTFIIQSVNEVRSGPSVMCYMLQLED